MEFIPPLVTVPEDWRLVFISTERNETISIERNNTLNELAEEVFSVRFIQNSEEDEQLVFYGNLTDFTSSGLEITLSFREPLLVSVGSSPDQVEVRLSKKYFL